MFRILTHTGLVEVADDHYLLALSGESLSTVIITNANSIGLVDISIFNHFPKSVKKFVFSVYRKL